MVDEAWKDIKDYEGFYQVSNLGRIKSLVGWNGKEYISREKILKPVIYDNKYASVTLHKNKGQVSKEVHRIVAETFLANPNHYPHVMHLDENKYNNEAKNLKWGTAKENCNFPEHKKRISKAMTGKSGELNNFYGHKHSEVTKQKLSQNKIGACIKGKNPNAKKVKCDGMIFDCIMDCAEYYSIHRSTMGRYLNHPKSMPKEFKDKGLRFYEE